MLGAKIRIPEDAPISPRWQGRQGVVTQLLCPQLLPYLIAANVEGTNLILKYEDFEMVPPEDGAPTA